MKFLTRTAFFLAACIATGAPAFAGDGQPELVDTVARVVPYEGVLDVNGAGFNGLVDIVFTLYGAAEGGEAVWTESWTAAEGRPVAVTGGRFSVNLGSHEDIEAVIAGSAQVFLGLAVKRPEDADFTALAGRQRLNPVPYALWTARATHLDVSGTASVGENLTVAGTLNADDYYIEDPDGGYDPLFSHEGEALALGVNDGSFGAGLRVDMPLTAQYGVQLDDGDGAASALRYTGGRLTIGTMNRFGGELEVMGRLHVRSDGDIDGNLNVDGTATIDQAVTLGSTLDVQSTSRLRGNVTMNGTVSIAQCRICVNHQNFGNNRTYQCVAMVSGQRTGSVSRNSTVFGNTAIGESSLLFLCDGGGTASGEGTILQDGSVQR